ncbi:MAG: hypothetical protein ACK5F0_00930 [Flavobacteriales bacterium]|jgi:hypothetical protein
MESLSKRLVDEIKGFTAGSGDAKTLDKAIATAHELLEKLYILRYKSYEAGIFKETPNEIPEFDLAALSVEEEQINQIEQIAHAAPAPSEQLFDLPSHEDAGEQIITHEDQPELLPLNDIVPTVEEELPIAIEPVIQAEIPLEPLVASTPLALDALISISHGKHEKIDKFNGNYSLKEKITFINELFNGSSESFASAVKQIDSHASMDTLMPTLNYLSATHTWSNANQEALSKFIEKVVAKYAS